MLPSRHRSIRTELLVTFINDEVGLGWNSEGELEV
jgi:hypothetical protein